MIKAHRIARGWSQEQLAEISGLNVRTIQRIERGQNAGLESLKCLAAVFDMDLATLRQSGEEQENELFLGTNPILPVVDVKETARFYQQLLGFDIELLWENPPYAVVARGRTILEFGEGRKPFAGSGVCIIFVADADRVYQELIERELEFVGDLADRDYGSRDFRIKDNNGNTLIFSSPLIDREKIIAAKNIATG